MYNVWKKYKHFPLYGGRSFKRRPNVHLWWSAICSFIYNEYFYKMKTVSVYATLHFQCVLLFKCTCNIFFQKHVKKFRKKLFIVGKLLKIRTMSSLNLYLKPIKIVFAWGEVMKIMLLRQCCLWKILTVCICVWANNFHFWSCLSKQV